MNDECRIPDFIIHRSSLIAMFPQLLRAARPYQWIKNLLLYAGFLFTLGARDAREPFARATLGALLFCLLSASAYILNDVLDAEADRRHPTKRNRPVASGRLSQRAALAAAVVLLAAGLAGSFAAGSGFGLLSLVYIALTVGYSVILKHVVLLDVMVLALGYVVRAAAGAVIVGVPTSFWLALCTMLLALFLGLCKRRAELAAGADSPDRRAVMAEYTLPLLDQMISVVTSSALLAYALYTYFTPTNPAPSAAWRFADHRLTFTIPFVVYGIYRYLYLVFRRDAGETPELLFLRDSPLRWNTALWAAACAGARLASRWL